MKRIIKNLIASTIALMVVFGSSLTAEASDLTWVYEHNLELTTQWVNPGDYVNNQAEQVDAEEQYIIDLSNEIVSGATDDFEKLEKIYDWVTTNICYDYDEVSHNATVITNEDKVRADEAGFLLVYTRDDGSTGSLILGGRGLQTAILRRGVCSGYSVLLSDLLKAQEIPSIVIHGYAGDDLPQMQGAVRSGVTNHAWNAAFVNGEWVFLDSTWDSGNRYSGGAYNYAGSGGRKYFAISLPDLSMDHYFSNFGEADKEDIPSIWAQTEVWEAITKGIVPYNLQNSYEQPITRQEFCQMATALWRGEDTALETKKSPFLDVDDTAVTRAYELGIIKGVGQAKFDPQRNITREEAATMLMRIGRLFQVQGGGQNIAFEDISEISGWSKEGVEYVSTNGIMTGVQSCFYPKETYTVQEAILTFNRLAEMIGI